jgi:2-keto-3-deoxy-L-rhamnonate aldolase RhmA
VIVNTAKARLDRGEVAIGLGIRQLRSADSALIARACGFDWMMIDTEHNAMDTDAMAQVAGGALAAGVTPVIRVASHEPYHCGRALDAGALGVIVPNVSTPGQARLVASSCRFPPRGQRSIPGAMPQLGYADMPLRDAMSQVDRNVLVVVMLETPEAIQNASQIAAVDGVDVLLVGGNDLAACYGVPGEVGHALIDDACQHVAAAADAADKVSGIAGIYDLPLAERYLSYGPRFVLGGSDLALLMSAARSRVAQLRTVSVGGATA